MTNSENVHTATALQCALLSEVATSEHVDTAQGCCTSIGWLLFIRTFQALLLKGSHGRSALGKKALPDPWSADNLSWGGNGSLMSRHIQLYCLRQCASPRSLASNALLKSPPCTLAHMHQHKHADTLPPTHTYSFTPTQIHTSTHLFH